MKGCLDKLVNPFQASFVPGRQTIDNIIIGQELVHIMKNSKAKDGDLLLKLDLEKDYNKVN